MTDTTTTIVTVNVRRRSLDTWQQNVEASTANYATDEWKARALAKIEFQRGVLADLDDDYELPTVREVVYGASTGRIEALLSPEEQAAVAWQHRSNYDLGEFKAALMEAASAADDHGLDRLALGFPTLVGGIRRWRSESGFADRIRALVADF